MNTVPTNIKRASCGPTCSLGRNRKGGTMRYVAELVAVALLAMLLAAACGASQAGELQTEAEAVELGGAESVHANLKMAAGELKVGGGADSLMEADFAYSAPDWQPEVSYDDVSRGTGTLSVEQPNKSADMRDDGRNEWDIHL